MDKCGRLTLARNLYAWYDGARKTVTVSADVELNPFTSVAHICPNPLSRILPPPDAREFLVEVASKSHGPIVPLPIVLTRVYYSYQSDAQPAAVRVYSMGVDNPMASDVPVKTAPPPALYADAAATATSTATASSSASSSTASTAPAAAGGQITGVGFSQTFSYEEAIQAALADLRTKLPPRNPDIATAGNVVKVFARTGGNIRPGLEITVAAD